MRKHGTVLFCVSSLLACLSYPLTAQQTIGAPSEPAGMPTSGGYKPPALSLASLLDSDKLLSTAFMNFLQTGDSAKFHKTVASEAAAGNVGAQLLLAEQYIPEQCTFQPNRDVPRCGPNGDEPPRVIFRSNPLGIPASYEEAAHWLEQASSRGSGEASEVLAQLITRMLANGHSTSYTATDSTKLHALGRSQGFDVEPISLTCYQLTSGEEALKFVGPPSHSLVVRAPPEHPFSEDELHQLEAAGVRGTLRYESDSEGGESVLLTRPEGPVVHMRVILDHDPGHEIHLPMSAHQDVIYIQQGDHFITLPADIRTLPRFLSLIPQRKDDPQVSIFEQQMDGAFSGNFCARF